MRYWIFKDYNCVYVMHGVGTKYYKIGMTANIRNRLYEIRKASPVDIELIAVHYVNKHEFFENALHKRFQHVRRGNSEWFALSENDVAFLSVETSELISRVLLPRRGMINLIPIVS